MNHRILFVDDELSVLNAFQRTFRDMDFEVYTSGSARLALEVLAEVAIDIVVSDECMTQMSGAEFLSRVRRAHPDTIRIMLTGQATLDAAIKTINQGEVYRFFRKPVDTRALGQFLLRTLTLRRQGSGGDPDPANRLKIVLEEKHQGITDIPRTESGAIIISTATKDMEPC